jgi:hypothetical protein
VWILNNRIYVLMLPSIRQIHSVLQVFHRRFLHLTMFVNRL